MLSQLKETIMVQYEFNLEHIDNVMALVLGPDGYDITKIANPLADDDSLVLAMERAQQYLIDTYGVDQLVEKGILLAVDITVH